MSRVDSNNFGDGWQKKKVSEEIRQDRHEQSDKDMSNSRKMVDGLLHAKTNDVSQKSSATSTSDAAKAATQPTERQTTQPAVQAPRVEMQQEGAKVQGQEQAFQKAKSDAKNLEQLSTKQVQSRTDSQTVTRQAVTSTPQTPQANISQNPQQSTFNLAQVAARAPQPQARATTENATRNVDTRRAAPQDQNSVRPNEQNVNPQQVTTPNNAVTQNAVNLQGQMQQAGLQPNREGTRSEPTSEGEGEGRVSSKSSGQSRAGGVYKSGAQKNLDRLLEGGGGLSADAGGEEASDSEAPVSQAPTFLNEIPHEDASLTIFNEYDTSNPGLEVVLAKRNILEQHVVKSFVGERISQIAAFNQNLEGRINDMLTVRPISERIIQETESEIKLVASNFIPKNVYGGISG